MKSAIVLQIQMLITHFISCPLIASCNVVFLNSSFHTPLQFVINKLFKKILDILVSCVIMKDRGKKIGPYLSSRALQIIGIFTVA